MANFFSSKANSEKSKLRLQKNGLIILWGGIAPILCTLLVWPFRQTLGTASILMIYNLGVFLVAAHQGRNASNLATLLSIAGFAFFFAPPIFSFAVTGIDNIIGLLIMLIVSHTTSNMLDKIKLQTESAQEKESQATILYRLNKFLSNTINEDTLVRTAVINIYKDFKVLSVLLIPNQHGNFSYPDDTPMKQSLRRVSLLVVKRVFQENITLSPIVINNNMYLPLQGTKQRVGVIVMQCIDPAFKIFLETYLNQIALALERLNLAHQAKEAIFQAEAEAVRNSLLSAISHDLRTPLTRIVGLSSTLMDDAFLSVDERLDFSKTIHDEAQRMSDLMNKILDMARLSSGTIVLKREWYALEEIIGSALTRLETLLKDHPVQIHLSDGLPLLWVDAVLLQQVLINLLENVTKYTPTGTLVEIIAELLPSTLTLVVADRGPGIVPGMEEKLFEKFYRAVPESTLGGIGLGLSLCRSIMEAHQGTIKAANRLDGGAVFTLVLPLHNPPQLFLDVDESRELI